MKELPSNFDWVSARAECSSAVMFQLLKADISKNVEARKALNDAIAEEFHFRLIADGAQIAVVREPRYGATTVSVIAFWLKPHGISVQDEAQKELFFAGLTLNNAGTCKFKVGDEELDRWQLARRALEPLMFSR